MQTTFQSGRELRFTFHGTRGTIAPGHPSVEFGNHTTCVEVGVPGESSLFVDLGTAAPFALGEAYEAGRRDFDILMTHLHADHLTGAFACAPFYQPDCTIRVWSTRSDTVAAVRELFRHPYHPVPFDKIMARVSFLQIRVGEHIMFAGGRLNVRSAPVPHPQGCVSYRFDDGENAIVFATDVELAEDHMVDQLERLLRFPYPAGLAIFDGFFAPDQIGSFRHWGHSSWDEVGGFCRPIGIGTIVLTHHHQYATDQMLLDMEAASGLPFARDGQTWIMRHNRAGMGSRP